MVFTHFPVQEQAERRVKSAEASLYLFLFFSKKNCAECLKKIVKDLNDLSPPFYVLGIVPGNELEDEQELRLITKAEFPLSRFEKYRKYVPLYTPTLIGVSPSGVVVFVLPEISRSKNIYLKGFLTSILARLDHLLKDEKAQDKNGG
jgi:hypothetical protein